MRRSRNSTIIQKESETCLGFREWRTMSVVREKSGKIHHRIVTTIKDGHSYGAELGTLWVDGHPRWLKNVTSLLS